MDLSEDVFLLHDWTISATTDVPFYLELVQATQDEILEIGAGRGRISALVASMGKRIVAMDTGANALRYAQRNWHEDGGGAGPCYLAADIRNRCLCNAFGLILATHRSFERLLLDSERVRVFQDCAAMLKANGLMVVHVWATPTEAGGLIREKTEEVSPTEQHGLLRIVRREEKELPRKVRRYTLRVEEVNGTKQVQNFPPLELRGYSPTELDSLGLRSGLRIEARYANFQKMPYVPGANELIWVYRKR